MKYLIPQKLESPRLHMRLFEEKDWEELAKMFQDEECVRYTLKTTQKPAQSWRILASYLGHWMLRGYGPYAVIEKGSGKLLGPVGLWFPPEWPEPEIKWSLLREFWGQGYATEAAMAVKEMAASELKSKRLISLILPKNEASKKVALRIGGHLEKTIPFREEFAEVYAYDLRKT